MDFVAHGSQLDAEFGSDNAGAAVCGITGDADAHEAFLDWTAGPPALGRLRMRRRCKSSRERDEFEVRELVELLEGLEFGVARSTKPGMHVCKVSIIVAGMGDEFPCACGQMAEQGCDGFCVEAAGGEHAGGAVGGGKAFFRDDAPEGRLEAAEEAYLEAAMTGSLRRCMEAPCRLKGIADGADSCGSGGSQDGTEHGRKHVDMLVGVDVGEVESAIL